MKSGTGRYIGIGVGLALWVTTVPLAQEGPEGLTVTTNGEAVTLPPLSSLAGVEAALRAERLVEVALEALIADVRDHQKEIDALEVRLVTNGEALKTESVRYEEERLTFEPDIEAYNREDAALRADDAQLRKDQLPVVALIEDYNRLPENQRTAELYDRIAEMKAPLDARFAALQKRKAALADRYRALEKQLAELATPLNEIQDLDKSLRGERDDKTAALERAFEQLRASHEYGRAIASKLDSLGRTPPETLAPLLTAAGRTLKELRELALDSKQPD
jgi:predicted  nucleic acid-binding Zn-ribbon protein